MQSKGGGALSKKSTSSSSSSKVGSTKSSSGKGKGAAAPKFKKDGTPIKERKKKDPNEPKVSSSNSWPQQHELCDSANSRVLWSLINWLVLQRPATAYFIFMQDKRASIQKELGSVEKTGS
jgi:hypothetical protein